MKSPGSRAGLLLFVLGAIGAVAAGAWGILRSRPSTPGPLPGITGPAADAGARPSAVTRRDPALDRPLTASADAFRLYTEGVSEWGSRPDQALMKLQSATRLDAAFAPAHYRLAWTAVLVSADSVGRAAIRSALAASERLPEPYRTTAAPLSHFVGGAFDQASLALREALAAQPDDADVHLLAGLLAGCSCDHFDPEAAATHLEAALGAEPDLALARSLLIDLRGEAGRPEPAVARARLTGREGDPEAHADLGRALIWNGEMTEALGMADEVLRRGGDVLAAGLGLAFVLTGDHGGVRSLDDSELDPGRSVEGNVRAHLSGGINEVWGGRFEQAAERFERGAEHSRAPWRRRDAARFFLLMGRVRSVAGRHVEALAALQAAQRVGGNQAVLEYALGASAIAAGRLDEAARSAYRLGHEMRRDQPGWTEPWRLLLEGEIALAKGDATGAGRLIDDAWERQSKGSVGMQDCIAGNVEAYFLDARGRAALAAGKPLEALEAFERIRALGARGFHQPEISVQALYLSGRALEDLGEVARAVERYRLFVERWGKADKPPAETEDAGARLGRLAQQSPGNK